LSTTFAKLARFSACGDVCHQAGEASDIGNLKSCLGRLRARRFRHYRARKAELGGLLEAGRALRDRPNGTGK
jgi:hypothetical protein